MRKSLTYKIFVYLSDIRTSGLNTTVSGTYKEDKLCMILSGTQKWFGNTHACKPTHAQYACVFIFYDQETRCTNLKLFVTMGLFTCVL